MKTLPGALAAFLLVPALFAQDKKPVPAHPKVDQQKVDEAIKKGCQVIMGAGFGSFGHGQRNQPLAMQSHAELVLLTLLHSGYYDENSQEIQGLVQFVLTKQIGSTYTASLMAMALQKLNPRKYQMRIAQCAQFLVDNQCENGQWDYGEPALIEPPKDPVATTAPRGQGDDVATSGGSGSASGASSAPKSTKKAGKTEALPKVPIRKKKPGPPNGDNSNSQYAALGVRACIDAGCDIEVRVLQQARKWWTGSQNSDGGWGYNGNGTTGSDDNPDGVCNASYGSMTVGAVGALCIYDYYLGTDYKRDGNVVRGIEWLNKQYDVTKNPRKNNFAYLYYLYGLERVGMLYGTETIGAHEWYPDGANHLLKIQNPFGSWDTTDKIAQGPRDTCFAILFLRRGTAPLKPPQAVATGGGNNPAVANGGAPVANAGGNPQANQGGLSGMARTVNEFAPGWRLINNLNAPGTEKLGAVRGKSGVLTTTPPNLTATPTLRRQLEVPAGGQTRLHLVVGHHESGEWTLIVRVDSKDILTKVIGASTSKDGWVELSVDLSPYAGKSFLLELVNQPGGKGVEVAYWAEIAVRDQ